MNVRIILSIVAFLALHAGAAALAQQPQFGDVVALGNCSSSFENEECGAFAIVYTPELNERFSFGLRLPPRFGHPYVQGASTIVFDPHDRFTVSSSDPLGLFSFSPAFEYRSDVFAPGILDLTMNARGTLIGLRFGGRAVLLPNGQLPEEELSLPVTPGYQVRRTDLSLDQCTLFYTETRFTTTDTPHVKRFDICTRTPLPDVNLPLQPCANGAPQVRVTPDGALLVALCSAAFRVDSAGIRVYSLPNGHRSRGLAVSADGRSFWSIADSTLIQVSANDGTVLKSRSFDDLFGRAGVALYGVPPAAAQAALIPLFRSRTLLLFAAVLAFLATLSIARQIR